MATLRAELDALEKDEKNFDREGKKWEEQKKVDQDALPRAAAPNGSLQRRTEKNYETPKSEVGRLKAKPKLKSSKRVVELRLFTLRDKLLNH